MISHPMVVNQECGICYENLCTNKCAQCSFTLCKECAEKMTDRVATTSLKNQCPQCFKPSPWMKNLIDYQTESLELQASELVMTSQITVTNTSDLENQIGGNYIDNCIVPDVQDKIKYILFRLLHIIFTLFLCTITGFLFFLAINRVNMFYDAINHNNTQQIVILLMMFCISGVFILIACLLVTLIIAACAGCICIAMQDNN
jgi:hypothetical protein